MNDLQTQGALADSFISIETKDDNKTQSSVGTQGQDPWGVRNLPFLLEYLESRFTFFASLVSVVGYIIISAFGSMENIGQYFGYIFFLFLVYVFYITTQRGGLFKITTKTTWLWIFGILSLTFFVFILVQNISHIKSFYKIVNESFTLDMNLSTSTNITETSTSTEIIATTSASTSDR